MDAVWICIGCAEYIGSLFAVQQVLAGQHGMRGSLLRIRFVKMACLYGK